MNDIVTNYIISSDGVIVHTPDMHIKSTHKNKSGYLMCNIYVGTKWKLISVHRLVANAFIPNPENKSEVNHIDGNKLNNMVSNLEWVTHDENIQHANRTGLNSYKSGLDARHNKYAKSMLMSVLNI